MNRDGNMLATEETSAAPVSQIYQQITLFTHLGVYMYSKSIISLFIIRFVYINPFQHKVAKESSHFPLKISIMYLC